MERDLLQFGISSFLLFCGLLGWLVGIMILVVGVGVVYLSFCLFHFIVCLFVVCC